MVKVLSLFDGISCGMVAFERAGIPVTEYHACEIDKYAIQISQKNYQQIVRHGSVVDYHPDRHFDYLIGGTPCQGFSFAGKQLAFNDPRSVLFFEYVRILKECRVINPNIKFLLENVRMKNQHRQVITETLGVAPERINSALVSAQNRVRDYWANWEITQPVDLKISGQDFQGIPTQNDYILKNKILTSLGNGSLDRRGYYKGNSNSQRVYGLRKKLPTLLTNNTGGNNPLWITTDDKTAHRASIELCEWLQTLDVGYTATAPLDQRYKTIGNGWTVDIISHILKCSVH